MDLMVHDQSTKVLTATMIFIWTDLLSKPAKSSIFFLPKCFWQQSAKFLCYSDIMYRCIHISVYYERLVINWLWGGCHATRHSNRTFVYFTLFKFTSLSIEERTEGVHLTWWNLHQRLSYMTDHLLVSFLMYC